MQAAEKSQQQLREKICHQDGVVCTTLSFFHMLEYVLHLQQSDVFRAAAIFVHIEGVIEGVRHTFCLTAISCSGL